MDQYTKIYTRSWGLKKKRDKPAPLVVLPATKKPLTINGSCYRNCQKANELFFLELDDVLGNILVIISFHVFDK